MSICMFGMCVYAHEQDSDDISLQDGFPVVLAVWSQYTALDT
jgi:hypothetical protein